MHKPVCSIKTCLHTIFLIALIAPLASLADTQSLQEITSAIKNLEGDNEPKCYATASRLEDFMFGTPLSSPARFAKNDLSRAFIQHLWKQASASALALKYKQVNSAQLDAATAKIFSYTPDTNQHWTLHFNDRIEVTIHKNDLRQYASIAYSLRALLAVQQEYILTGNKHTLPLSRDTIDQLKQTLDLFALAVLKIADQRARRNNQYQISETLLRETWQQLLSIETPQQTDTTAPTPVSASNNTGEAGLTVLHSIIDQKVASYKQYNQVSNQLFIRNLQVFLSKNRWPETQQESQRFIGLFQEAVIVFANDLYLGAEIVANHHKHNLIRESDVSAFIQHFIPHQVNQYEDVIFFPRLPPTRQVPIESYDMDAFRDSGNHWRYLQFAIQHPEFNGQLAPDPFAAELLAENIAQFGVLLLRLVGQVGKEQGDNRIKADHVALAIARINERITGNNAQPTVDAQQAAITSTPTVTDAAQSGYFTDITRPYGITHLHRSSDWLSRQLRSYLKKDENTGIITIPPAFGGAGVAAEDINADGFVDILLLSGLGNHLYLNQRGERFIDVSATSGLQWRRPEDQQPGEPRQPLIADLDNDGLQDIVITYVDDNHRVFKNRGNATFEDVTAQAKLGGKGLVGGPATLLDYDNDGLLDIYITYFGDYLHGVLPTLKRYNDNGLPNKLFKNLGGFTFREVAIDESFNNTGWTQAVTHTDLNNDTLQDLIVGNDFGVNSYYLNKGNGKFEDIAAKIGTRKPSYTMSISSTDLNRDTFPDIYIANIVVMNKDETYVQPNATTPMKFNPDKLSDMRVVEANDLFLSRPLAEGGAHYQLSELVERGYSSTGWSWDADFFDFDNDGDDDLYVLNGMNEYNLYSSENPYYTDPDNNARQGIVIPVSTKESNVFFVNEGGKLQNRSQQSGADLLGNSRSAAYLDLDNDGDLDIVLNNYHDHATLYRNNTQRHQRNWLKVRLVGNSQKGINRDAVGAKILVTASGRQMSREVQSTTGYMSVHPKEQHFGLGNASAVDIKVIWPNGKVTGQQSVNANTRVLLQYPL